MDRERFEMQWKMNSMLGPLYLVATDDCLTGIYFSRAEAPLVKSLSGTGKQLKILKKAESQLEEYFSGERKKFDLPLNATGTDFQKQVWEQLAQIPYGQTCSYSEIASRINNQGAVRAVGSANGKNPFCIVVPCHRVIAADGSLGGYSGGLDKKTKLLNLERTVNL